jgi:nitrogen fixation NifU-like protein
VGEIPDASGIGNVGNPICVSPETLVFTNPDIKEIKDISEGTQVLSHDGNYHRVTAVYTRQYKGKICSLIINNLGNSSVTPEHHILALKLNSRYKFSVYKRFRPDWYCVEELKKGDVVLYPIPKQTQNIREIDFDIEKPKWDFKSKVLPKKINITNEFLRLVGYYLAEGYTRTDPCKGTLGFVFGSKEKDYIEDVALLMKNVFGVTPSKLQLLHNAINILFYSARLARFFTKHFGKGAEDKHLPYWMIYLPVEKQENILCGLYRGDGYIDIKRQRAKFVTISKQLAYQLRLLLLRQKIISNFSVGKAYGIHKESYLLYIQDDQSLKKITNIMRINIKIKQRKLNTHKSWFDNNFYYTTVREIQPLQYKGRVYNLEVEGVHSYVSDTFVLHNCGDVMRMYIKVENNIIVDAKFKTFGCGAAISTSSMVTEMVKGKTVEEALEISNRAVAEALGGLPPVKMHCSVLAEHALRAALADYYKKIGKDPSAFAPKEELHDEH